MYTNRGFAVVAAFATLAAANPLPDAVMEPPLPPAPPSSGGGIPVPANAFSRPGVATFNDFAAQGSSTCYPSEDGGFSRFSDALTRPGIFGAAASDISPDIAFGGPCKETNSKPYDDGICSNHALLNQAHASCPQLLRVCPSDSPARGQTTCLKVTSFGLLGGEGTPFTSGSVIVRIIDSCPAGHPKNYCKVNQVPIYQRCGDYRVNQLDIDGTAYKALTGRDGWTQDGGFPNLSIYVEKFACPGESTATA